MFIIIPKINSQTVKFITAKTSYFTRHNMKNFKCCTEHIFCMIYKFQLHNKLIESNLKYCSSSINPNNLHLYKKKKKLIFQVIVKTIHRNGIFKCLYCCLNFLGSSLPPTRSRSRSESSSFLCFSTASSGSMWSIRAGLCPVPGSAMLQQPEPDLQPTTDLPLSLPQQQFHSIICFSHQSNPRAAVASAL